MRSTFKVIIIGLSVVTGCSLLAFRERQNTPVNAIRQTLCLQADSFLIAARKLQTISADIQHIHLLKKQFRQVRIAYKKLEWAAEYFDPLTTRNVNGPPVPETELSGQVIMPDGLQVIEQLLFPRFNPSSKKQLANLLAALVTNADEYREYFTKASLQDWQVLDAVKQEVFRVETLGLNDFDDPLLQNCFAESAVALASSRHVTISYVKTTNKNLDQRFLSAIRYLKTPVSSNKFNRAVFLTAFANPLTRAITQLHQHLDLPDVRYNRLLNQDAATLFDKNAFNCNAYTAAPEDSATDQKIALGKKLFFDPILSGTATRSCASCHQPEKAFTDGMVKNLDITGKHPIARNTPTLINAALQPAQFYDMRAASLEDQASDVVGNADEMHGDMILSTQKLWNNVVYRQLFINAFPVKNRTIIDTSEVMNALASYIRSLTALNSRFDAYMQGDQKALSQTDIDGFNLFMGKARCSTCHYLPLFNGTLPPRYMQMDAEVIGVPKIKNGKIIDPDLGRFAILAQDFNRHSFKVTTVRNTAQTAPYMHNGVFNTLEEVIDFYDQGGGVGMGIKLENQTLDAGHLHLTATEKSELIAFIKSLNSR